MEFVSEKGVGWRDFEPELVVLNSGIGTGMKLRIDQGTGSLGPCQISFVKP